MELQAAFDVHMEYLCARQREEWRRPKAAKLTRPNGYNDFFEIRFMSDRVQQRPIGYFGPGQNTFTVLLWATEKGQLLPRDWHGIATRRREEIASRPDQSKPFKWNS
ncbi:MAG: hypothetical protein J0H72_19050 [Burkholderiales bacterium]|nr:hypothetical protein [Burkholderiales bacterium]